MPPSRRSGVRCPSTSERSRTRPFRSMRNSRRFSRRSAMRRVGSSLSRVRRALENRTLGQAMRHFQNMQRAHKASADETDPLSPMEQKVLEWIYSTPFYQLRSDSVEVLPQFPLGDYLRQLDPGYKHASWRVDFLLSVDTES